MAPINKTTPAPNKKAPASTPTLRKQQSIVSFFKRPSSDDIENEVQLPSEARKPSVKPLALRSSPAPFSSDPIGPSDPLPTPLAEKAANLQIRTIESKKGKHDIDGRFDEPTSSVSLPQSSPLTRRARNQGVKYTEDSSEEDGIPSVSRKTTRGTKRQKFVVSDDEDDFVAVSPAPEDDDDMDDFIVPDDEDSDVPRAKKRKRTTAAKSSKAASPEKEPSLNETNSAVSTASKFTYQPGQFRDKSSSYNSSTTKSKFVSSATKRTNGLDKKDDERYPWLANVKDIDKNPVGHPDYDPRTLHIPDYAWNKFSPFEKQYWEIKQNLFDTVVFFKKGKFYELYEDDATIGHQQFDLKLTDRVNMRMVGVPESSLSMWASQFIAKGYKIARVDQKETALGKEMREKNSKPDKNDKVIRRELECVLTAGTLVDENMLQNDMSTFCVSIKESTDEGAPAFGVCFVDTATGAFSLTGFVDDMDATKFETLIAQIRPKELVLEKSCLSSRALRILKTNTDPTTIWTYLKPGREFWTEDMTYRELDASDYFTKDGKTKWPDALEESKEKPLVMSAFGGLLWYLRSLKIDKDIVSLGNFNWYDPIRRTTSLVLDGQTLQNLEIFSNSFDGGSTGTLFALLNQCITAFGKRTFRQWLCHPLSDAKMINARLDAVDAIMADNTLLRLFSEQLDKLPDLERMISRIHAGSCRPVDFLRVLEGFEQIKLTVEEIKECGFDQTGIVSNLVSSIPDLDRLLEQWITAFDRSKVREEGVLVPEPGVEEDFDESQKTIEGIEGELEDLLVKYRKELKAPAAKYCDSGKEIYLIEVPTKVAVPNEWVQMSSTAKVKRYWPPVVKRKVKELLEAREVHGQIVKDILGRFCTRFDDEYTDWLKVVKIIAQLDCLISLAKASLSLGGPSCRPEFVDSKRSVLNFEELRHPCMLPTVGDFIPNDVVLGGDSQKITLLTGANAAGKSTILRMTCVGVIMAQIGCYVPAKSAILTPVDRIMSRLGANDNIFAAQSTFFVELSETKKILSEATPRSLVILDELGRGTSSYDGVAIAQSVLHHVATHIGCIGYFATHYGSLATEFADHPEIAPKRMRIRVDDDERNITFLYKLEPGVAEKSFGMYCAAMCGINRKIIDRAEEAAKNFEHTSRLKDSIDLKRKKDELQGSGAYVPLGLQSDFAWLLQKAEATKSNDMEEEMDEMAMDVLLKSIAAL